MVQVQCLRRGSFTLPARQVPISLIPSSAPHVAFRANACQRETWDLFWSPPARCAVWAKAGQGQDQKAGAAGWGWRGLGGPWKYMVRWLPLAVIFDYAVSVPFRSSFFAYVIFSAFSLDSTTHASQGLCCKMKRVHFNMWVKPLISSQLGNKCKCRHRVLGIECWILENAVGIFDFLLETLQFLCEFWSLCDENFRVSFKNLKIQLNFKFNNNFHVNTLLTKQYLIN